MSASSSPTVEGIHRSIPRGARIPVAIVALILLLLVADLIWVHETTWETRLWPSATPAKVQFDGRAYRRSGEHRLDAAEVVVGHTIGGGDIYSLPDPRTPTVIFVRNGDTTYGYDLMGGP